MWIRLVKGFLDERCTLAVSVSHENVLMRAVDEGTETSSVIAIRL